MRIPKLVKAVLLSTALFTMAAPAYADYAYTPLSNKITATFKVNAPAEPTYVLKWLDSSNHELETLPLQTVNSGDSMDLKLRATVNQDFKDIRYYFKIKRTDGTTITDSDIILAQYGDSGVVTLSGNTDGELYLSYSKRFVTVTSPSMDSKFKVTFNAAGQYQINVVAVSMND
ncbi:MULTISPECIES: hypothetical protein [Paenibacillus]|uniref:Uncharacterized protein n=1 Tax=Paenibacillus pabuli TaxID=1472 RepID=A0A855Y407_9BACL|nr:MULTISPECIES: hypothetical protein [Paenibacillus]PWW45072.1 hypothetical protein DET56_101272 [Paenibacillus pabuli]PXW11408.1 hypothetical protein DEU73_101271 [Paenibacillus taichungensis]